MILCESMMHGENVCGCVNVWVCGCGGCVDVMERC